MWSLTRGCVMWSQALEIGADSVPITRYHVIHDNLKDNAGWDDNLSRFKIPGSETWEFTTTTTMQGSHYSWELDHWTGQEWTHSTVPWTTKFRRWKWQDLYSEFSVLRVRRWIRGWTGSICRLGVRFRRSREIGHVQEIKARYCNQTFLEMQTAEIKNCAFIDLVFET